MRRIPRQQLHADFLRAIRASGYSVRTLAALADFTAHQNLWSLLNAKRVPVSALNVQRLHTLGAVVGYDGPVFR